MFTAHAVPGYSKPFYLPTSIKFTVDMVPANLIGWVRSGVERSASQVTDITVHDTGNRRDGANARMHRNYLHNGPRDENGNKLKVGFNAVVDDKEIIWLTPGGEITWAAGTAIGNLVSDHFELCINDGIDHSKAMDYMAALVAADMYARGLSIAAVVQHYKWYGKPCPGRMRSLGLWPTFLNMVAAAYARIVAFVSGKPVPDPVPPATALKKGDRVITTDNLNLRVGSGTGYAVSDVLPAGTTAEIINGPRSSNGHTWYDVKGTFGTGWVAADWLSVLPPEDTKPSPVWPYPAPVMPAWWNELQNGTYIVDGGMMWFRSSDLYRVKRDTKRLQLAIGSSKEVGPVLKAGETFRDAAKGQSAMDDRPYVITDGGTRVALEDLEFVQEE